jgi:hypothetical protein
VCLLLTDKCGDFCLDFTENYLSMERGGIGRHLVFLASQGFLYWICIALIESRLLIRLYTVLEHLCIKSEKTRWDVTREHVRGENYFAVFREQLLSVFLRHLYRTEVRDWPLF